jgi:hypothetical protein
MTEIGFSAQIDPWISNQWDLFRQGNQKKQDKKGQGNGRVYRQGDGIVVYPQASSGAFRTIGAVHFSSRTSTRRA